jgi:tRNA dimethylallyltransferase
MNINKPIVLPVIVLVGPTAIGKTDLSLRISAEFDCEIISMDSMQVYRYMDIGTAKVSKEERQQIAHHLIDILNPDEQYDAARFVQDARDAINMITSRGKIPLITGGTGLYLSALTNGLFDEVNVKDEERKKLRERLNKEGREVLHRECSRLTRIAAGGSIKTIPSDYYAAWKFITVPAHLGQNIYASRSNPRNNLS